MPTDLRPLSAQRYDSCRGDVVILSPDQEGLVQVFEFRSECVRAEIIGITIGLSRLRDHDCCPAERFALPAVRAHVDWCIGNASFSARADVLNGTVLSVAAEQVKLCVEYVICGDECADDLPSFKVSAGASYGASSGFPAQLTEMVCAAPGEVGQVAIPPFAIGFTVLPIEPSAGPVRGSILGPNGAPRVSFESASPIAGGRKFIPLFNGAAYIEIDNTDGASPRAAFVIFELAL